MTEEEIWQFNYAAITGVVTDAASSISGLWAINKSWNARFGTSSKVKFGGSVKSSQKLMNQMKQRC